jgi:beta-1,4-mannosyltransferase
MRVAFVPVWLDNPYHAELEKALSALGIHVLRPDSLKFFCRDYKAGIANVDVVHLHALPPFSWSRLSFVRYVRFYLRLSYLQKTGVRLVWTVHNLQNHDSRQPWIESFLARSVAQRVDAMIVHGNTAKQILESRWGSQTSQRIHVIPHGHYIHSYRNNTSREAARAHFRFSESNLVFGFLGQIRPYKGVVEMVKAFKACTDPNVRLIIAGRPINEAMTKEIALAIHGDVRIKFLPGHVADDDVQVHLNACDVFVLPYQRVLTSGAAVLAMSFGKPCIAPRVGCVTDMLDEEGALFFDPSIDGDLERAIRQTVACRQRLPEMGFHNLRRAAGWGWKEIGRETAGVYEQCLGDGRKAVTHKELTGKIEEPTI